ncbi:MAG TPA: hypothetical protein VMD29_15535 [Terracidiphilus sp.]|nr:hypothetical protein [Terracidiphilus sp.]
MSFPLQRAFQAAHLLLLRSASLIVPRGERHDWLREWRAELWHIRHERPAAVASSLGSEWEITAFCAGCFPDAVEIRRQAWHPRRAPVHESAAQCILCLCAVLILCAVPARLLTGVRAEYQSCRFRLQSALISVGDVYGPASQPSIPFAQYRTWKSSRQRYFDGLAFYRITAEAMENEAHESGTLRVAHASANLLPILDLPLQLSPTLPEDSSLPALIVSREAWDRGFGRNLLLTGSLIQVGGETVRIAGIMSYGSWQLPGHPDAWLLGDDLPASAASRGFVIAHLSPLGQAMMSGDHISIMDDGSETSFDGALLEQPMDGPERVFLFALLLALLALPAVTSVAMSESSFSAHRPSFTTALLRWAFLAAKFAIGACIGYFASCDLAYWNLVGFSPMAEFAQFVFAFTLCLFLFRWAVLDQRHRCPVCLRRVTHPAQVGIASRTFLGWNGTEMICTGGHTLLHVPSLPTSWFSSQRWLYLDASWEFLFAGSDLP